MSRIEAIFADLRSRGGRALMPFVTGGYPSIDSTAEVLPALERAGASIVEVGIPFSDPIADGPVIAASMHDALERGVMPELVLQAVERVRPEISIGVVAMVSESIVDRISPARFLARCVEAGVDGIIVPDADTFGGANSPGGEIAALATDCGLTCTFLVAPTSGPERIASLTELSSGFVYALARTGLTGERTEAPEVADRVQAIRQHTDLPIAVGFGISTAAHVNHVVQHADAAIVGTALVRRMGEAKNPVDVAASFVRELSAGLDQREHAGG